MMSLSIFSKKFLFNILHPFCFLFVKIALDFYDFTKIKLYFDNKSTIIPLKGVNKMSKSKRNVDMLHGPMLSKILLFALPLALSSILQLLFNAADTIVVGQFSGSQALAAVGSNGALINLIVNAFMGLSIGANVIVARYRGQGKEDRIKKAVHTAILISIICGIVLAIVGFFLAPELLTIMSTPADVIDLSALYLRIYFIGMPFLMVYNFGAAILRSIGDTKRPLYFLTISGVVNVILNLFFVIVLGMSVDGVATATIISEFVSAVLVVRTLCHEEGSLKLNLRELAIDKQCLIDIVKVGLPAGLQGCIFSLSNVVIQSSINTFGTIVVAGNSAASNIEGFIYVTMNAFHQSAVTFSSQNFGAKQYKRCDKALTISVACAAVFGTVIGMTFILFGEELLRLYTNDPLVIEAGMVRMSYLFRFQALNGAMDVMVGGLRAVGYSVLPTIVSLTGVCLLRLVWIATIFQANPTIHMLYLVYPVTWTVTVTAHIISYIIVRRKINQNTQYDNHLEQA